MSSITSKTQDPHFEKILASYLKDEKVILSDLEKEMKQRWEVAFSLLLNYHSREQAVKVLKERHDCSLATAYRDINNALALFGDITKSRKEGWRYVIFEYNQNLFQMATKKKDLEVMGKCLDRMIKLSDLDKDDFAFDPEKIKSQTYDIVLSDALKVPLMKMLHKGVVNMNNLEVEDIPHEPIDGQTGH